MIGYTPWCIANSLSAAKAFITVAVRILKFEVRAAAIQASTQQSQAIKAELERQLRQDMRVHNGR